MCGGGFVFQLGANYAHGIDVQAGHVAYTIGELSRRGIQSANVSMRRKNSGSAISLILEYRALYWGAPRHLHAQLQPRRHEQAISGRST